MIPDYLEKILNAQVYDVAVETLLDYAPNLSARIGNTILFKRKDMQPVFSFKLRGAYNKIAQLSPERLKSEALRAAHPSSTDRAASFPRAQRKYAHPTPE